ncbi:hypothetical protein E1293_36700 [Actinomadura darangshiensis]|uniref:Uncharacterized protein n=1 Tax=Actinomadura darangshiensis TaxID=705336 RepID=A0A4R5A901_9ACTN|nr:hypothetical protein [Actinomadura darangshiensis]TDD68683.1 hypothetical protein E1293_36700 [Actinomadura darangshiensis]
MSLPNIADQIVRAALVEDQTFGELLPQLMQATQTASPAELNAALPRLAEGIAEAPPNLGGWLAVVTGACVEQGADPAPAGAAVVDRIVDVAAAAMAFADAWEQSAGGRPLPSMQDEQPSQQIFDTVSTALGDSAVTAMMSWFALPQFAMAGCTVLQMAPSVRAGIEDRDFHAFAAGKAAQHLGQMDHYQALLRVLDGERLLVLDRASRHGWTVTIGGIGDNFQLHMLLAGALIGRPGGLTGDRPAPEIIAAFLDADAPPGPPVVSSPWNLVDAHGEWIWNEGVPADVPVVNGTRVVVIDPPSYERTFPAGRRFPLMPATLRVEGMHLPEDLDAWWPHIKPATR